MKIFYHNDNDGRAAAAMIYMYTTKTLNMECHYNDFIEVDYVKKPSVNDIKPNESVFIVDYSFTANTVHILKEMAKVTSNIQWIDHHKSSLEVIDEVKDLLFDIEIDMRRSAAMITYDRFIKGGDCDNENTRDIIKYVDDYDRWIHNYKESLYFNIGSILYDTHPTSSIWKDFPSHIINSGEVIKKYKDTVNKSYCDTFAYECTINNHKCIVFNTPEFSSQAFVDKYDEYKFAVRFVYDGNIFRYSIYSSLEDIDCSEIAKHIDPSGGGHKGAAGFRSKDIVFKPDRFYTVHL